MKTPRRLRTSIRHDPIHPTDYLKFKISSACEDCSHFSMEKRACTIGFNSEFHRKNIQEESYKLRGKIAFCRFLEID